MAARCGEFGDDRRPEWPLNESQDFFVELLAPFWIGQGFEELLAAEALQLAESFLDRAPISNRLLKPLILLLGQRDANGLAIDLASPWITRAAPCSSAILDIAFANPARVCQLSAKAGVLLLA